MKSEVRRGRKFVEYHDPDTQDEFTFTQEISGADVSYQETDGSWHPADENWATDGVDGFILKNDKLNHKVRLKGTGGRTWYPRRNVNTEYMTFGVPQYWNGKRWANFGFSGWSVEGKTITLNTRENVTILVHNRWNGIKIDWVLASSSAPSRMHYPVALTGITYVDGIIYGADGTRLGQLTPTTATDANGAELVCSGSFASGYVEFQADVTGAVYPVVIDPDFGIGDNVFGWAGGSNADYATARATSANGGLSTATAEYYNGQRLNGSTYTNGRGLFAFNTSSIGADATVTQVNLKLTVKYGQTCPVDHVIKKVDWTESRETAYDEVLAADTDANWLNTNDVTSNNTQYTSANLSTAWINKTGTTKYGLICSNDIAGTPPTGDERIGVYHFANATESYRPVLTVTYTAGSAGVPKQFLHYARLRSN